MFIRIAGCCLLLSLAACGNGPVKVVDALTPEEAVNQVRVTQVNVTYSELAAEKIREDDAERAEEGDTDENGAPELTALPLTEVLKRAVHKEIAKRGIAGERAVDIAISVDTMQYQNGLATIVFGSSDELAGNVTVTDSASGETLAEFYIDLVKGNGGLLGLAIRGWGIRERFAETFAEHIADELYGED